MALTDEYIAGFFDGEGYAGIIYHAHGDKRYLRFNVSFGQTDPRPLIAIRDKYGGTLNLVKIKSNPRAKPQWRLDLSPRPAEVFLRAIRPYLIAKAEVVDVWLAAREIQKARRSRIRTMEDHAQEAVVLAEIRRLNHRGVA